MWDVVVFSESQDASAGLTLFAPVSDDVYATSGDDLYIKRSARYLIGAFAFGDTVARARVVTPSMGSLEREVPIFRTFGNIRLVDLPHFRRPDLLEENEPLNFYIQNGAAEQDYGVVFLSSVPRLSKVSWDLVMRFTGSTSLTANAWTKVSLTPDITLPEGRYRIVGFIPISANGIVARIVPVEGARRPGFVCARTEYDALSKSLDNWLADTGIVFTPRTVPKVEFLSAAADTSETVIMFLKRV